MVREREHKKNRDSIQERKRANCAHLKLLPFPFGSLLMLPLSFTEPGYFLLYVKPAMDKIHDIMKDMKVVH